MKLLMLLDPRDKPYLSRLSDIIHGHKASVYWGKVESLGEIDVFAKRIGAQAVITNRVDVLSLDTPDAKVAHFAGSILHTPRGLPVLCLGPIKQLYSVPHGEWLAKRYVSKILAPETWPVQSEFVYKILREEAEYEEFRDKLDSAWLCSIDIETMPPYIIRTVSYTLKFHDGSTDTGCFKLDSMDKVRWMRNINAHPIAKVTQNGKYECAHFFAWHAPMVNWIGDTMNAMHATWSELPKDLNVVSSVFNVKHRYWKDMRESQTDAELLHYNALDTWSTCEAFCSWLETAPQYAIDNYNIKWPQMYLTHEMEMRGLKRDNLRKLRWNRIYNARMDRELKSLRTMLHEPHFNPSSPKQTVALMKVLTGKAWDSSDEAHMKKVSNLHPLNERILGSIIDYRGDRKLVSSYLGIGEESKDFNGRWLYSINPTGTDTGREASNAHAFWCGQNVQNVPNEAWQVKNTVIADDGYELWEADFSQAEARGVAYCSGDEALLAAVNSEHDFHSLNASAFFGVPYEQIYDDATGKTLNKPLRKLAKRVNHGANYNMREHVLLETMGEKHVREAQVLLKLPRHYSLLDVCQHLLRQFERTYPRIKTAYYQYIVSQVRKYHKLVGPTGWTRYCFREPWSNKMALNAYVAHVTQSLNAMILDRVALDILKWRQVEDLWNTVKICAKIHDSILFQVPVGREDLVRKVQQLMTVPVQIADCFGKVRTMTVPVDVTHCGHRWDYA